MTKDNMREWVRRYVGKHPSLFFNYYGARPYYRRMLVDRRTQIVIEGFPRSGNTFAVVAFEQAQPGGVHIAHHLHMPAQVMRAARWQIPTIVLIRKPTDAVLSWVIREPQISIGEAMKHYVSFYEKVAEYRSAFVVGYFEEVTQDYGAVVERVNSKFGTRFSPFDHSKENVEGVFNHIETRHRSRTGGVLDEKRIARPSAAKAGMKDPLQKELQTPQIVELTARAEAIYKDFALVRAGDLA